MVMPEYGINEVAERLHGHLARYIEATYHLRDTGVIQERRALLQEPGTIGQRPFVETTPSYASGPNWADLRLPNSIGETLTEITAWQPSLGLPPRPYAHQTEALQAFLDQRRDIIVATGTGSGKTETFLLPVLSNLLLEAQSRPRSFAQPGCRALLLYPMNALVNDQIARLRRIFGDPRMRDLFRARYGDFPRFGMYTSRTPYPGVRSNERDGRDAGELIRQFLTIEKSDPGLLAELQARGRWPAKDLRAFFGNDGERWNARLNTGPDDSELLTRHEMQQYCPHLLMTNYSMLEYMLLRPIERNTFQQTREWLANDERNEFILVLDEAHMYRGAGGAEIGLLIRRLQDRLAIPRDRLRCILTSASLGHGEEADQAIVTFAEQLTGRPEQRSFTLVRGTREARPVARPGTAEEAVKFASFDLGAQFHRAENAPGAVSAIKALGRKLGWPTAPRDDDTLLREYVYRQLHGFGPLEHLVALTTAQAIEFASLAEQIFPASPADIAHEATMTLLSLGTYTRVGERPLLPTRVHLFVRGLPSLHACINPKCEQRRHDPGIEGLLGRLYTEPRTHCTCTVGARVYELYAHRPCGAIFLRVFGRGPSAQFYWHEGGGMVPLGEPLDECLLYLEPPHPSIVDRVERIWLDMTTGRVATKVPSDRERYRECYRPAPTGGARGRRPRGKQEVTDNEVVFTRCPACTRETRGNVGDLATRGEQPFATLVREQFEVQAASRDASDHYPNAGRKVLLFSDGRQKAARLARDLPREVEFDSFRQALALAWQRLTELDREPRLGKRLYIAFVSVCANHYLHFFDQDDGSQQQLLQDIRYFRDYCDADLATALDDEWEPSLPVRYRQALLRQLTDPFYSLYSMGVAIVQPNQKNRRLIEREMQGLSPSTKALLPDIAVYWTQEMLDHAAFDRGINLDTRRSVQQFFKARGLDTADRTFEGVLRDRAGLTEAQVQVLRKTLYRVLCELDAEGNALLDPSRLTINLTLDQVWWQCDSCGALQHSECVGWCFSCGIGQLSALRPGHPYLDARSGYFREPVRATLAGRRPMHLTAEEHTAQLGLVAK